PLIPGSLAALDGFMGAPLEDGNATFDETASLSFSYGSFPAVPSMHSYAGAVPSPFFQEYYLNDAAGNMVFVADVVSNRPDWNGTTSDYQLILPNDGSGIGYTVWADINYTCPAGGPPGGPDSDKDHVLTVSPPGIYEVQAGSTFSPGFVISNVGDYNEHYIEITLGCPSGFACGSGSIGTLFQGDEETVQVAITVDVPGEYVLTVCAENLFDTECEEFIVRVVAGCSVDSDCSQGQYCDEGTCEDKKPPFEPCQRGGECQTGLCDGGTCVYCEQDSDCDASDYCSDGSCVPVGCGCGIVADHSCAPYQCCADSDCGECNICSGNSCETLELDILIDSGEMLEGAEVYVHVVDNLGRGVGGARVFTSDGSTTADGNGHASITIPYDGIIYANFSCAQIGLMLDIMKQGTFILPEEIVVGQEVEVELVDNEGRPIAGVQVTVGGDSYTTDGNGRFKIVFDDPGPKTLIGNRPGYRIQDNLALVSPAGGIACYFPICLSWFVFYALTIWQLWLLSIILAAANVWLLHRRILESRKWIWKLIYTLGPLVLALPNLWLLNICSMSNVILLQFVAEVLLSILRRMRKRQLEEEVEGRAYEFMKKGPGKGTLPPNAPVDSSLPEPRPGKKSQDYEDTNDG
ncbi:MAG: hypothetical protein ACOY58_02240, partial [Candidatus Micrarchaeota archaeon]